MNTSCCTNPIRINTLLIKNRIVFPAMCTKYAAPRGLSPKNNRKATF